MVEDLNKHVVTRKSWKTCFLATDNNEHGQMFEWNLSSKFPLRERLNMGYLQYISNISISVHERIIMNQHMTCRRNNCVCVFLKFQENLQEVFNSKRVYCVCEISVLDCRGSLFYRKMVSTVKIRRYMLMMLNIVYAFNTFRSISFIALTLTRRIAHWCVG